MGLLGGFKAKLRANKRQPRRTNIVCVKFNALNPEFDASPSVLPSCSNTNPGRNDVIKEKRRPTKADIKGLFPTNGEATQVKNGPSPPPKQQAPQPPQPPQPPLRKIEDKPHFTSNIPTAAAAAVKKQAPNVPTPLLATKSPMNEEKVSFGSEEEDDDGNFKIGFTANRSATKPEAQTVEETSDDDDQEDEGNFKIHFVKNTKQHNGNLSDEQDSEDEEDDDDLDFGPINYSSQASSIFFGEEEEPIIMRPRNVVVGDDDNESRGSSASA